MATKTRRCVGSVRFGIEPHEAPLSEFPEQPSQKDGLGRMCREHWRAYTSGLRKDALARRGQPAKASKRRSSEPPNVEAAEDPITEDVPDVPEPSVVT